MRPAQIFPASAGKAGQAKGGRGAARTSGRRTPDRRRAEAAGKGAKSFLQVHGSDCGEGRRAGPQSHSRRLRALGYDGCSLRWFVDLPSA